LLVASELYHLQAESLTQFQPPKLEPLAGMPVFVHESRFYKWRSEYRSSCFDAHGRKLSTGNQLLNPVVLIPAWALMLIVTKKERK
jgi:hypothetical protein